MFRRKTAEYTLLALCDIAGHEQRDGGGGIRAFEIAKRNHLPKAYVAKILSQLAHAGILHSDRGPRGGFRLNRPSDQISLLDAFDSVNAMGAPAASHASVNGELSRKVHDTIRIVEDRASSALRQHFKNTTLSDIVRMDGQSTLKQ